MSIPPTIRIREQQQKPALDVILLVDASGSMRATDRISMLNAGIREAISGIREAANQVQTVDLRFRAVAFSTGARWHIPVPQPIHALNWSDLAADGETDMGKAFELVAEALPVMYTGQYTAHPLLILITDGRPTDDFAGGLARLTSGNRMSIRESIAFGEDAGIADLQRFQTQSNAAPHRATDAASLARHLRRIVTAALQKLAWPAAGGGGQQELGAEPEEKKNEEQPWWRIKDQSEGSDSVW